MIAFEATLIGVASLVGLDHSIRILTQERERVQRDLAGLYKTKIGDLNGTTRSKPHSKTKPPSVHFQSGNRPLCRSHGANPVLTKDKSRVTCDRCKHVLSTTPSFESQKPTEKSEMNGTDRKKRTVHTDESLREGILALLKKKPASAKGVRDGVHGDRRRIGKMLAVLSKEGLIKKGDISVKVGVRTFNGQGYQLVS